MGKADNPLRRWKVHCLEDKNSPHKSRWVAELRELGLTPELEILEEIPVEGWQEIEKEYIRVFRMIGIRLTNIAEGGEGGAPIGNKNWLGRKHSEETKQKMRASGSGKIRTEAHSKNISLGKKGKASSFRGKHHSEVAKRKLRLANLGKTLSTEHRKKIGQHFSGKKLSQEHRDKIRVANTGKKFSLEHRKKISLGKTGQVSWNAGKTISEDTRQKLVEAWVRRKEKAQV